MDNALLVVGRLGGLAGVVLSALAAVMRVMGHYSLGGYQLVTLLIAGMAAMIFACLCFLTVLTGRSAGRP